MACQPASFVRLSPGTGARWGALLVGIAGAILCAAPGRSWAAEEGAIELGRFGMTAPEGWQRRPPRSQLVSYEFAAPAAKGDSETGRLTIMAAGGGVEANIDRWIGQFTQADGSSTKDRARVEKTTIAEQEVHLVDLSGTYDDKPAPFAPGVKKPGYRMLAAIVVTDEASFFIKFYGPERTIAEHEQAFRAMIDGLKVR